MKTRTRRIRIICLPKAGPENPYQKLMMQGLSSSGRAEVIHGIDNKFVGLFLSAVKYRPTYIHIDWLHRYYQRKHIALTFAFLPLFFVQVWIIRLLTNVNLVWTLHNIEPHDIRFPAIHKFVRSFFAKNCLWVRVFSESTIDRAAAYLKIPGSKFKVVPEGSYTSYYPNHVTREEARAYFGLPIDAKVYLFLGLIKPYKGISDFLRYFNQVKRPNEYLIIAGEVMDARYGDEIKKILSDRILFFGRFIASTDLQYFFNASDVVILPFTNVENSGSVILAMGFRKPILAPSVGVIRERLSTQCDLLFNGSISNIWARQNSYSNADLSRIGEMNFYNLTACSWQDFALSFENT